MPSLENILLDLLVKRISQKYIISIHQSHQVLGISFWPTWMTYTESLDDKGTSAMYEIVRAYSSKPRTSGNR